MILERIGSLIQKAYHEKLLFILKRAKVLRDFLMAIMYGLLLIRLVKVKINHLMGKDSSA